METDFQNQVDEALRMLRRRDLKALGRHKLAKLQVVRTRLRGRPEELPAIFVGEVLKDLLIEVIRNLKPSTLQTSEYRSQPDWRRYLILRDYVVHGQRWKDVADELGLARSAFFEVRKQAAESVASALWQLEQNTLQRPISVEHNLPHPPYTAFVERRDERGQSYVERIIDILTSRRGWLVIIDGAPGVGKTALAYKVADECIERELFDAVIWVSAKQRELSPEEGISILSEHQYVTSLGAILDTIGKTVGNVRKVLTLSSVEEKLMLVRDILLSTNCLIVIDNLEALSEDTLSQVASFLNDLPSPSKALLTSREQHYVGEIRVTLPGMEEDEAMKFMRIEAEARRLRRLSDEELRYIYSETKGVPLAMKYALGQMAIFGYSAQEAVGLRLGHEKLIDYMFERAYGKLNESEKQILHLMSIFVEPASAEAIRIAGDLGETQVVTGLGRLYQLFFVDRVDQNRYDILPYVDSFLCSVREQETRWGGNFGKEFTDRAYQNLVRYYVNRLKGPDIDAHLMFLRREKRNVLAVLEWCYENREASLMIDLVEVLGRPLGILGYANDRITWGQRAMRMCEMLNEPQKKARFAINDVAWAYIRNGQIEQAKALLEENLNLSQERGYLREGALALHNLGRLYRNIGEPEKAVGYLTEALLIWMNLGDQEWQARTAAVLGRIEYQSGHLSQARAHLEEALRLRRSIGHENEIVETLADLALVSLAEGKEREAAHLLDESLYRGQELPGPGPSYAYAVYRAAEMEKELGHLSEVRRLAGEAYRIYEDFGVNYMAQEVQRFLSVLDQDE